MANENEEQITDVSSLLALLPRQNLTLIEKVGIQQSANFNFERLVHKRNLINQEAAIKMSAYITIIQADPKLAGNYADVMIEDKLISEDCLEEVLRYVRMGVTPYHLWIEKIKADLELPSYAYTSASKIGMLTVYLMRTMRCSLIGYQKLRKALEEDLDEDSPLRSVLTWTQARYSEIPQEFIDGYMRFANTDKKQERIDFQNNEVSLFSETLIDMLNYPIILDLVKAMEKQDKGLFSAIWNERPHMPSKFGRIDPNTMGAPQIKVMGEADNGSELRFGDNGVEGTGIFSDVGAGGGVADNGVITGSATTLTPTPKYVGGGMGHFAIDLLGYGPSGETPEQMEAWYIEHLRKLGIDPLQFLPKEDNDETVQAANETSGEDEAISNIPVGYRVIKKAKDSSERIMYKGKVHKTEAKAKEELEFITKENPVMAKAFKFEVEPVYQ